MSGVSIDASFSQRLITEGIASTVANRLTDGITDDIINDQVEYGDTVASRQGLSGVSQRGISSGNKVETITVILFARTNLIREIYTKTGLMKMY